MSNEYYNYTNDLTPGTPVRSDDVDREFIAITEAFDLLSAPAVLRTGASLGGTDAGTANNYVITTTAGGVPVDLQILTFIPDNSNSGASVLSLNASANRAIVRNDGGPLQSRDIIAGVPVLVIYDITRTRWSLVGTTAEQINEQFRPGINNQSGTTYTLLSSDESKIILCDNAASISVTIPSNTTAPLPIGFISHIHQENAGQVTLVPDTGVTLLYATSLKTRARYSSLSVMKTATNTFKVIGDQATS